MSAANEDSWRRGISALLRSYAADLRGWATRLAGGYAIAIALLVGGILALFAAIAVGVSALFHVIERHYGADVAYASVGGGLLVVAIVLFLIGWSMLVRRWPPLPRPHRQLQAAKGMSVGPAVLRAVEGMPRAKGAKADPVTQLFVGVAAIMLIGWLVASRRRPQGEP